MVSSTKKIIIYGINQQAQQLYYYLNAELPGRAEAFTVDRDFFQEEMLLGKPVIPFEDVESKYPPTEYCILLSFGYKNMMRNREEKYWNCKKRGYEIVNFISKDAKVYTSDIGEGVIIYPNCVIAPFVKIGNGCFFETSCTIAHHSQIGKFNFFAPGVTTGGAVKIGNNCFFGISAVIASCRKINDMSVIGAGVTVTNDVETETVLRHVEALQLSRKPEKYI